MLIADPFNVKIYIDKTGRAWRPDDLVLSALLGNTRVEQLHTRAREGTRFSWWLLRSANFLLQKCAVLCNTARIRFPETPSICNGAQACENVRNSLGLNYKSAALSILATGCRITELWPWSEATLYFSRLELSAFSVLLPRTDFRCL